MLSITSTLRSITISEFTKRIIPDLKTREGQITLIVAAVLVYWGICLAAYLIWRTWKVRSNPNNSQTINKIENQKNNSPLSTKKEEVLAKNPRQGIAIKSDPKNKTFPIFVKCTDGITRTVSCSENTTIEEFKQKLRAEFDIIENQHYLVFAGKQLENGRSLADYRISEMTTVHIVIRGLRGD